MVQTTIIYDIVASFTYTYSMFRDERDVNIRIIYVIQKEYKSSSSFDKINSLVKYKRDLVVHKCNDDWNPKGKRTHQNCNCCIRLLAVQSSSSNTNQPISIATNCKNTLTDNKHINSFITSVVRFTFPKNE